MKNLPAGKLRSLSGLWSVRYVESKGPLAMVDADQEV